MKTPTLNSPMLPSAPSERTHTEIVMVGAAGVGAWQITDARADVDAAVLKADTDVHIVNEQRDALQARADTLAMGLKELRSPITNMQDAAVLASLADEFAVIP